MSQHRITKGLDLPLDGAPVQSVSDGPAVYRAAIVADDFPGLKPRLAVSVGERVRAGQLLFEDRSTPGVRHTAPGTGTVSAIHRGERRALQSVVIDLDASAIPENGDGRGDRLDLPPRHGPGGLDAADIRDMLVRTGIWTAFRTRPFGRVPAPATSPAAIFCTAVDTNPLAPRPEVVLTDRKADFARGLDLVRRLTEGPTYLCVGGGSVLAQEAPSGIEVEQFTGPHPSGTAGLHVHLLQPVGRKRTVWTIGYQDVVAVGALFNDGRIDLTRVYAVAGPPIANPRLLRSRLGASIGDLIRETDVTGEARWISGSVLSGKAATGPVYGYMGRYDVQLSALPEGGERKPLGWLAPGARSYSASRTFLASFLGRRAGFEFNTDTHGSLRAMVPIGLYEKVMPMDLMPTFLLRALAAEDVRQAERLGCLELIEEDLALASFVDPGKVDYGPLLRRVLDRIESDW